MNYSEILDLIEPTLSEIGTHEIIHTMEDGTEVYVEILVEDEYDPMGDGDVKHGCFPSILTVSVCDNEEDAGNDDVNVEKTETLRGLIEGLIETI